MSNQTDHVALQIQARDEIAIRIFMEKAKALKLVEPRLHAGQETAVQQIAVESYKLANAFIAGRSEAR